MIRRGDVLWLAALCAITGFLIVPALHQVFIGVTVSHPYLMGFVKFTILATMGELLTIRLVTGTWGKPPGMVYKALIWGVVGLSIVLMFGLFSEGVQGAIRKGLLPGRRG